MRRLAKGRRGIYIKREPRLLLLTETGAGTARFAPPPRARLPPTDYLLRPRPTAYGPGSTAI
nr:MAG TPA: hypothetical protein [Caudoviricetes sp.]